MKEKLIDFYKNNKKAVYIGSAALAVVIIGLIVLLVSCGNGKNGSKDKETGKAPSSFNVTVQSEGGMVFPKVDVYIYEDSSLSEMVAAAKTDENGKMSFDFSTGDFTLSGGYIKDSQSLSFNGSSFNHNFQIKYYYSQSCTEYYTAKETFGTRVEKY